MSSPEKSDHPRNPAPRSSNLPDDRRVAQCRRAPDLGPRILFFSGGTALRPLCRNLKRFTHNSVHLVTPFDSGGSSAKLREAFDVFSVGDLRNRLIALADETLRGNPEIYRLFSYRFEHDADVAQLAVRLEQLVAGDHELVAEIPEPLGRLVRTCLARFLQSAPSGFDLRAASVGNLVLVGGWLEHDKDVDSIVFLFSKLVSVLGAVRPITDVSAQLRFTLEDGREIVGQHLVTGKGGGTAGAKIVHMDLVRSFTDPTSIDVELDDRVARQIENAALIVFPMGSFFSSLLANLTVRGVGRAIHALDCPKVYVPNLGEDPESLGYDLVDRVRKIAEFVGRDVGDDLAVSEVVHAVLVDRDTVDDEQCSRLHELGVQAIRMPLVSTQSRPYYDPERLVEVLLSLT